MDKLIGVVNMYKINQHTIQNGAAIADAKPVTPNLTSCHAELVSFCRKHLFSCKMGPLGTVSASQRRYAFSLVEMLMALLVASLLLAALAPVMTRKFGDNVNVNGVGGGSKSEYTRLFDKDTEWNVPNGVNVINVTAIGGGGAGGGASYGFQEFTSTTNDWIVPDGVTKIRVFMTGAGGGGASGGLGTDYAYGNIPALSNAEGEILTAGTYTFANGITPPDSYKAPELDSKCKTSNISNNWTIVSDNTTVEANKRFTKFPDNINVTLDKVTACGAGGGNSNHNWYNVSGGSGAYITNQNVNSSQTASQIALIIGRSGGNAGYNGYDSYSNGKVYRTGTAAGGGGGTGMTNGGAGASGSWRSTDQGWISGGGGGGGSTGLKIGSKTIVEAPGGGGAGGSVWGCACCSGGCYSYAYGGTGGAGGGLPGSGGNGAYREQPGCGNKAGTAGGGGSGSSSGVTGYGGTSGNFCGGASAGGGGAGAGGLGGGRGTLNTIWGTSKCNAGQPGAIKLWYSTASATNGLKCQYYTKSNSGAGGGAGQVWLGEISVTPGQKLNFNIGIGGDKTTTYGSNGKDGGSTSIVSNVTSIATVNGGKGGKYINSDNESEISNTYGTGGGIKKSSFSNSAKYINWLNLNTSSIAPGQSGVKASSPNNGAGGGKGGNTITKNNSLAQGGTGGGAQSDGADALSTSYGAGGGGGGGVINDGGTPGHGGKGANGYIYIEWGSTNGGGGASGQIIEKKAVWVTPGTKIKINVGKGGEPTPILTTLNGVSGQFGQKGNNGGNTTVMIPNEETITALGGDGGNPGGTNHGKGGNGGDEANESIGGNKNNLIIENSIPGSNGNDDFGGNGGNIIQDICPLLYELNKASYGGCGGNNPSTNGCYPSTGPTGSKGYGIGAGGGGGSIQSNTAYPGGNGSDGAVIIEWNN